MSDTKVYSHHDIPQILRDFLSYHEIIKGHSKLTVDEYYLDVRNFFRFLKQQRFPELSNKDLSEIDIADIDLKFISSVTRSELYDYMAFLSRERIQYQNAKNPHFGLSAASRARKLASIRSFFEYLTKKTHQLKENPIADMDVPKTRKTLPKYLTLEQSIDLLTSVDGNHKERDACILMLFLNCGLRISELVGLNLSDIQGETLRVLGKGQKVRILFLNPACQDSLNRYLAVRRQIPDCSALFLSSRKQRMTRSAIHAMVKRRLEEAGLDSSQYSSHKLRHTAATLMLKNGVDVRAVQEVLGHDHLNTTQIYTHIDNEDLRVAAKANPLANMKVKKPDRPDS